MLTALMLCCASDDSTFGQEHDLVPRHISSNDVDIIDEAFLHGYAHNIVAENVNGTNIPTLTIQCTDKSVHKPDKDLGIDRQFFSVWTRDLYWGFLGWAQAGDDKVLEMMKSSLQLLVMAKENNQALGQSKVWPLNDKRFYIPQAYTSGLRPALDFYPWCSESQVDFLLLAHNYWELGGDRSYIESIWDEIVYVTQTVELMDTDGNSLPDALWGSYDYMGIGLDSEEPLMSAKTSLAYQSVARLAYLLGRNEYADHLDTLAGKVKETMNKPVEEGGFWKQEGNTGYYVQGRKITPGQESVKDRFIPYNNLVPIWCGMTDSVQDKAIFTRLDTHFDKYYDLTYGPMYCASAAKNEEAVMDCSSVTWLAFLDVYLRGKKDHEANRSKIYHMLMQHAGDAGGIPFAEGVGVSGYLTGGAGRSWDNGNFFHMLVCGIYGLEKSRDGISISAPQKIDEMPLTEILNFCWRDAVYNFRWKGEGRKIGNVLISGNELNPESGKYKLTAKTGVHEVLIILE